MKAPVLESHFHKVTGLTCNFIKNKLQHRCFPVNIVKFLRTVFLQKTSGGGLSWSIKSFNFTNIPDVYYENNSVILMIFLRTYFQNNLFQITNFFE